MTSKNLYSKLMKEDLKSRLWAISLIGLGFFFLYPVLVAFEAGSIKEYVNYEVGLAKYAEQITKWLSFNNGMTVFVMMLVSLICGLSSFSYLNSRSKVDFYHSIPVKREKLYIANYLNGILIVAVPYAVSMALAVCVGISNGIDGIQLWHTALAAYGLHMIYFILMYTVVVIASVMTGNLVVAFLGCAVFSFYMPIAVALSQVYFSIFYKTYVGLSAGEMVENLTRISPVVEYIYQISQYTEGTNIWPAALMALAVAAVIAVLGCILYRKRPSEAAGKAMAFTITKPVIRILLTLLSAMGLGGFFWSMRQSTGWAVFGILCGAVISHCIIEIIYHFDFKKLFANKGQLIACTLVSIAVLFVFRYDLTGYDKYLPAEGKVEKSAVVVYKFSNWTSYGSIEKRPDGAYEWNTEYGQGYALENMSYTDTANLLTIAAAGIEETLKESDARDRNPESELPVTAQTIDGRESENYSDVTICYTLKSGRRVYRNYTVNLDKMMPQMEKLYTSAEYQDATFPLMTKSAEHIAGIYYSEQRKEKRLDGLTAAEKSLMLDTYRREFASLTPEQMEKECPIGLIRFTSELEEEGMRWWEQQEKNGFKDYPRYQYSRGYLADRDYYPVYPSFKETIKLLKDKQVDVGSFFEKMDIQSVTVRWYKPVDEWGATETKEILITDPDEIAQLKQLMIGSGLQYYNSLYATSELDVGFTVEEDGNTQRYGANFPRGQMPEFITSRLTMEK